MVTRSLYSNSTNGLHSSMRTSVSSETLNFSQTPSQMRIRSLTTKLSGIQVNLDEDKQHRQAECELKIRLIDERIDSVYSTDADQGNIRTALNRLQEALASQHVGLEMLAEQGTKELRLVESSVVMDLQAERQQRKELESKTIKSIDEECYSIRLDMNKECKASEEEFERTQAEIRERANRLAAANRSASAEREEKHEQIIRRYTEELMILKETLKAEVTMREEAEQTQFKMLEDVATRMTADVAKERAERQHTEDTLLKLLEQTCQGIEVSLNQ
ncbi:hypothetical protein J8273_7726 [Carpediemonas membranifera]|uniref:Uncharacterized protein n=1 Tax=Carpediemonas membranifera TaxID=201153 RepID=A0A8J6APS5_9EUKA|nr:hypothetical protein J8273_7726 [Carpediemonas membranifera]|eukprot:KAG9390376.1 hypothetical protein J8273_7726 [Carpediemonas membranifera]